MFLETSDHIQNLSNSLDIFLNTLELLNIASEREIQEWLIAYSWYEWVLRLCTWENYSKKEGTQ